jgi:hypothetical protein
LSKAKATYNPAAVDADGDGMVQEGTEFERPVGTDLEFEQGIVGSVLGETSEGPSEAPVAVEEAAPAPITARAVFVAADGDSYATIAEQYPVPGLTKHERALQLMRFHGNKPLRAGVRIEL